jgi:hypothetical protein
VTITADESMSGGSLIARHIGGGVTIRCLGENSADGDINTVRAGWTHLSNPNSHTIGTLGDPVVIEADSVSAQDIDNILSLGDMYVTALATGNMSDIRTSLATNPPSGLTDYDAVLDIEANAIGEISIPFTQVGSNTGDLSGRIRVTDISFPFSGLFKVTGIFDGEFIIDDGLDAAATIQIGQDGLLGQVFVNYANGGAAWNASADVTVGSETLSGPGYAPTPADLGGGAIGEVRFQLHDEACMPLAGTYGSPVAECWLQFYGPLVDLVEIFIIDDNGHIVGTGVFKPPVKIWREPNGGGSGAWIHGTYFYQTLPPGDGEHNTGLRIDKASGNVFESGYTYTITPETASTGLRCDVPGTPGVAGFSYVVTIN